MKQIKLFVALVVTALAVSLPAAAQARDRDHDKMPDRWETKHGLSVTKKNARGDRDRDDLSNLGEFRSHTDPLDADTDDDCIQDGDEDRDGDGVTNADENDQGEDGDDQGEDGDDQGEDDDDQGCDDDDQGEDED